MVQREGLLKQQGWMVLHNLGYVDTCILCCKPHRHQTSCELTHVSSEQSTGGRSCQGQSVANFASGSAFCLLVLLECMAARQCKHQLCINARRKQEQPCRTPGNKAVSLVTTFNVQECTVTHAGEQTHVRSNVHPGSLTSIQTTSTSS